MRSGYINDEKKQLSLDQNFSQKSDGDAAGQRAASKALQAALPYASDTRSVKFLFLPGGHDPDSFIRTEGA